MGIAEMLDELKQKALHDPKLRAELLATKKASQPFAAFCSKCRELGYEIYDMDLITAGEEAYAAMRRSTNGGGENSPMLEVEDDLYEHVAAGNGVTVISAMLSDPFGYGRIIRDEKGLSKIVEQKDATEEEQAVKEVNSGMYIFKCDALLAALSQITNDNAQGEYYLPDTIEIIKKMGLPVDAAAMEDADQIKGVNTLEQLAEAEEIMRSR